MIEDVFIFDNVVHMFNASEEQVIGRNGRIGQEHWLRMNNVVRPPGDNMRYGGKPGGDPMRQMGAQRGSRSLMWGLVARNKRAVTCDPATDEGRERMAALHGQLVNLGDTWRDQEHDKFAEEFAQTLHVIEAFVALEAEWNDTVDRARIPHPFLRHEWVRTWWDSFGGPSTGFARSGQASRQLHIIVVRDDRRTECGTPGPAVSAATLLAA